MHESPVEPKTTIRTKSTKARWLSAAGATVALVVSLAACGDVVPTGESGAETGSTSTSETFFTTDRVHAISVDFDDTEYEEMMAAYAAGGDKNWISVTVNIDGTTFENAGLRLKGNRSLRQALAESRGIELTQEDLEKEDADGDSSPGNSTDPATIPWLIRLDKYVDGQEYLGRHDFVVRGNDTDTYLNEAVAMAMIEEAGLPAHRVAFSAFSVNGGDSTLRLISEVPDDALWNEEWFGTDGATWKADSDGDWDYHGEDGASYESLWKQRTGAEEVGMTPIAQFMDFINNATDEEFQASLGDKLDIEQFATYLAVESLIGNQDTISGPGNNGYLHYDPETGLMTVVAWDHDVAFDSMGGLGDAGGMGVPGSTQGPEGGNMPGNAPDQMQPGNMEPGGGPGGMQPPTGGEAPGEGVMPPAGMTPPDETAGPGAGTVPDGGIVPDGMEQPQSMEMPNMGGPGRGGMAGSNILESRFMASTTFNDMYETAYTYLQASLVTSGFADEVLNEYAELLINDAGELISAETVVTERNAIAQYLARIAAADSELGSGQS